MAFDRQKIGGSWTTGLLSQNKGPLQVLLSQLFSSLVNVGVKVLVTQLPAPLNPIQILNTRMIFTLALSFGCCWYKKVADYPFGPAVVRPLMILRAVGGSCGALGFYYSLEYLPLGESTILNLLAPLGSCCFMALSIPGSFSRIHMIACVVSLCSVVLIAKPSLLIGSHAAGVDPPVPPGELAVRSQDTGGDGKLLAGVVFAMLGAFGGACTYSCIRLIGCRAHPLISVNYFAFTVIIFTSVAMLIPTLRPNFNFSLVQVILLLFISIISFSTEFFMTAGLAAEKSSSATLMIFSQVLFATIMDWLIWGLVPTIPSVCGGFLLVLSISVVLMHSPKESSREQDRQLEQPSWWQLEERPEIRSPTAVDGDIDLASLLEEDET